MKKKDANVVEDYNQFETFDLENSNVQDKPNELVFTKSNLQLNDEPI